MRGKSTKNKKRISGILEVTVDKKSREFGFYDPRDDAIHITKSTIRKIGDYDSGFGFGEKLIEDIAEFYVCFINHETIHWVLDKIGEVEASDKFDNLEIYILLN